MEITGIRAWFDEYLRAFTACGRGESEDARVLLQYYAVPLLLSTDQNALVLTSTDEVLDTAAREIERMRAANYDRSETLRSDIVALNATTALHTAAFSRRRKDDSEIVRLTATYLIVDGADGRRIAALVVHTR